MFQEFMRLYKYHQNHSKETASEQVGFFKKFIGRLEKNSDKKVEELKVLDIGCGKTYPFSFMFSLAGADVTGLDTQYVGVGFLKYFKMMVHNGFKVALKTFVRDLLFVSQERKQIISSGGFFRNKKKIDFIQASAEKIPFPDKAFDIVFSFCAFEHIPDIDKAISECARVLKKDGLIYITYHLFTSISGGHDIQWFYPDDRTSGRSRPWNHLYGDNAQSHYMDYGLNGNRLADYRRIFGNRVDVIEEIFDKLEGDNLLTEQVKNDLKEYSEEELTTSFVTVIARKKS